MLAPQTMKSKSLEGMFGLLWSGWEISSEGCLMLYSLAKTYINKEVLELNVN